MSQGTKIDEGEAFLRDLFACLGSEYCSLAPIVSVFLSSDFVSLGSGTEQVGPYQLRESELEGGLPLTATSVLFSVEHSPSHS